MFSDLRTNLAYYNNRDYSCFADMVTIKTVLGHHNIMMSGAPDKKGKCPSCPSWLLPDEAHKIMIRILAVHAE